MNVWNQSRQAFVTSLGPFSHGSCKFTHRMWNIRFSNTCLVSAFQNNLRACIWQFSNRFCFFFFEVVVIDAWSRHFVELLGRLVCQLTISFHTLLCMTSHVMRTMKKYEDFEGMFVFLFHPLNFAIRTWFCNCPQYLCLFHIVVECSPSVHDPGKMLVLPSQLLCWVLSTSDQYCVSFQPILCHPHTQIRIILFHDEQRDIPNLEFSPSHASMGLSQIAFPIIVLCQRMTIQISFKRNNSVFLSWTMI